MLELVSHDNLIETCLVGDYYVFSCSVLVEVFSGYRVRRGGGNVISDILIVPVYALETYRITAQARTSLRQPPPPPTSPVVVPHAYNAPLLSS